MLYPAELRAQDLHAVLPEKTSSCKVNLTTTSHTLCSIVESLEQLMMNSSEKTGAMSWIFLGLWISGALGLFFHLKNTSHDHLLKCQNLLGQWAQTADKIESPLRRWTEIAGICLSQNFQPIELNTNGSYKIWNPLAVKVVSENQVIEFGEYQKAWLCTDSGIEFYARPPTVSKTGTWVFVNELEISSTLESSKMSLNKSDLPPSLSYDLRFESTECSYSKTLTTNFTPKVSI